MSDGLVLKTTNNSLLSCDVDTLLIPVTRGEAFTANLTTVDEALGGLVREMVDSGEFGKKAYQVEVIPTLGRFPAKRVALVALGKVDERNVTLFRQAITTAARVLGRRGLRSAAADVADAPFPQEAAATALAEGAELSRYVAELYRTGERPETRLAELRVVGASDAALREGSIRGRAKNLARELTNEPGNKLDAPELDRRTAALAARVGLEYEALDEAAMESLGMGAILAVARGTETPARFLILRHWGHPEGREAGPLLTLVGKAVTFDTGGISLKPSADMGNMKTDMAGGAAVIAAMGAIAELGVPLNVLALVPAVDNLPDGRAWKPGDVITAMSGKTIETITTDAEGRMLLADALCYARQLGATHLVDIATLTGACGIALGNVASGMFGTDEELLSAVRAAGEDAGERHWPMPLFPEYSEQIRSEIADLKNSGGRLAGAITGAAFLREFVEKTPWVHLDVAASARADKARPWAPAGPTGIGVGTFINLAQRLAGPEAPGSPGEK